MTNPHEPSVPVPSEFNPALCAYRLARLEEVERGMKALNEKAHSLESSVDMLVSEMRHDRHDRRREREQAAEERDRILHIAQAAADSARTLMETVVLLQGTQEGRRLFATSLRVWLGVGFGLVGAIAAGVSIALAIAHARL